MYKILIHKDNEKLDIVYRFEIVSKEDAGFKRAFSDADLLDGEYQSVELAKTAARKWIKNRKLEAKNYFKTLSFEFED